MARTSIKMARASSKKADKTGSIKNKDGSGG